MDEYSSYLVVDSQVEWFSCTAINLTLLYLTCLDLP